jgi:hypothetical protein
MTERELSRNAARRLAIIRHAQEVTCNVSLTCRYNGITRQCFYIWLAGTRSWARKAYATVRRGRTQPRGRPKRRWSPRSSISGATTTSAPTGSRCT